MTVRALSVVAFSVLTTAALASCGGSEPLVLPPRPSSAPTTDLPALTVPSASGAPGASTAVGGAAEVASASWVPATGNLAGLSSECGNMSYLSSRPDRDMLIAGIALRGLWASTDGGTTWEALGTNAGSDQIVNRPTSIVYDPADPNRFWESGIYNDGGAYRTDDDAQTFRRLGDVVHSELIAVDFTDPERRTLLSGTHELPHLYRSTDSGQTWVDVGRNLPPDIGFAIAPLIIDDETYLLGTRSGPASGVFRTTDGGNTWTVVYEGGVSSPPLVASDGTLYFALEAGGGLAKSVDHGATWTFVPGRIDASPTLVELPDGRLVATASGHLAISTNQGATWTATGPEFPRQPAGFAYSPFQQAFFMWAFDCDLSSDNPLPTDAILRLDFAAPAP